MIAVHRLPYASADRRGMTLVEMLVATAMTLIIMGIVAQLFGFLALTLNRSRDTMSMSADVRSVANLLRRDLAGLTVQTIPPTPADADGGYLEIVEGSATDTSASSNFTSLTGDCDDLLMLTTRSLDQPFIGKFGSNGSLESPVAEVAWFCLQSPTALQTVVGTTLYTLYRRQLLVMDYVGQTPFLSNGNAMTGTLPNNDYDLSLRADGSVLRPNSLGDLTRREFRFLHNTSGATSAGLFPYNATVANISSSGIFSGTRQGEDVVLTNVLSFDVRVFDPRAPLRSTDVTAVDPGDPGYTSTNASNANVLGAYVDLGSGAASTALMGSPAAKSKLGTIYDTWSTHYEFNGIDEDSDGVVDDGTDGLDNDTSPSSAGYGIIDDAGEQETAPPYSVALRGVEIRIRVYEPTSRQVRQVTVRHSFVPY